MTGTVLRLRMAEHTSKPEAPGMLMSRIAMSGSLRLEALDGRWAVGRLHHQVSGLPQCVGHQIEQVRIIIGNQNLHVGGCAGRVSSKRV